MVERGGVGMSDSNVVPWWKALTIRPEIATSSGVVEDVQMSLFRAVYDTGTERPRYAKASYYGDITHPTPLLVDLLAKIAIRLGGGQDYQTVPALTRLDQGMGGGKSHACIGAWHCAANATDFAATDVGEAVFDKAREILGRDLPVDLNSPHVVVLPCDSSMTPGAPVQELDGSAYNLYERFLWRLFSKNSAAYEAYRPFFNDKAKIAEALRSLGRPVLIIIDELMDYVGNGLDGANKPELTAQDMGFLRAFLEAVKDVPNVAALVVMIESEKDSLAPSTAGSAARREELHQLLERNGRQAPVNENADFAAILRRRLFDSTPSIDVIARTAAQYNPVHANKSWKTKVHDVLNVSWTANFADEVARTYPFHPHLIHLAEHEWANLSGFQKVRSTIRVFAATAYALQQRAHTEQWVPALIGPGDLPLSDSAVRESILGSGLIADTKTQSNYRSIVQNDIVNISDDGGTARLLDLARHSPSSEVNPRATERAATSVFLASIVGSRGQGRRGASDPETKAAIAVPSTAFGIADADGIVKDMINPDIGLISIDIIAGRGGQPPRYYLTTVQTLPMLARAERARISDRDRDDILADTTEHLAVTGPFDKKIFVRANPGTSAREALIMRGLDDARTSRLIVLDPAQFSLRNGREAETLAALESVLGLGANRIAVEWASSAIFVMVNTQSRQHARRLAVEYLAWRRVIDAPEVQGDAAMREEAETKSSEARRALEGAVRRAFQHVVFLAQPDPDGDRHLMQATVETDENALDGRLVWKLLVEQQKAFDAGQLNARALLHNLRDNDYGRPLAEIRDSFWNAPRLPLLRGGESDLRQALFEAVRTGQLRIINASDQEVAVTASSEINLNSQGLRIARPLPPGGTEPGAAPGASGSSGGGGHTGGKGGGYKDGKGSVDPNAPSPTGQADAEKLLSFTVMQSLINNPDQADALASVFRKLYDIIDRRSASHIQGTIKIALNADAADALAQEASLLGIKVDLRDI